MKKYNKYKNSGIEWIGDIPAHWEMDRIASLGYFSKGKGISRSDLKDNGYPAIIYGDIYTKYNIKTDEILNHINDETTKSSVTIEKGDLLFTGSGETKEDIGKCITYLGNETIYAGGDVIILRQKKCDSLFLSYSLNSNSSIYQKASMAKGQIIIHIYASNLREIKLPLPNKNDQTAIANYLDRKTAEIDDLIDKKEKLLTLYEEEKTAIINDAVTGKKVWNGKTWAELVEVKDSGVEWLGEIPAQWEVKKLKYVADISLGKMLTNSDKGNYKKRKYLRAANIEWLKVNVEDVKEMWFSNNELVKLRLKKNDLLVSEGGEVGRTCIWKNEIEECYIQNSVHKISTNSNNVPNYFLYQFFILGQKGAFDSIVNRISIAHLTGEKIKEIGFVCPSREEQTAIVAYIEKENARIDGKMEKTKKLIELLKEYRTALISEAVTGKIKVFNNE